MSAGAHLSPLLRGVAVFLVALTVSTSLAVGGALFLVLQTRNQSRYNADLMKIMVSVSGCTVDDAPAGCTQKQKDRATAEGHVRVLDVECRIRLALAGHPSPPAGQPCAIPPYPPSP